MGREPSAEKKVAMTSPRKQIFVLADSGDGRGGGGQNMHQLINKKRQACFVCYAKLQNSKSSGKWGLFTDLSI